MCIILLFFFPRRMLLKIANVTNLNPVVKNSSMLVFLNGTVAGPDRTQSRLSSYLSLPPPSSLPPPPPVPPGSQELGQPGLEPGSMPPQAHPQVGFAKDLGLWTERSPVCPSLTPDLPYSAPFPEGGWVGICWPTGCMPAGRPPPPPPPVCTRGVCMCTVYTVQYCTP